MGHRLQKLLRALLPAGGFFCLSLALASPATAAITDPLSDTNPLVPITTAIPDAVLDIRYATPDNFLKQPVYPGPFAYLRQSTLGKLKKAADALRAQGYRLRIYDGYRPLAVQKKMWAIQPNSPYVANPKFGSIHNRGGAVDLSLVTIDGQDVVMPSEYDDFSPRAHHGYTGAGPEATRNAALLKKEMMAAGFTAITSEWWHYNDPATKKYPVLDIGFETLMGGE
jgi:D-alanyl-D-alanine dipeptidase